MQGSAKATMRDFVQRQLVQTMTSWDQRGSQLWRANPKRILFHMLSRVSSVRLSAFEKTELAQAVENLVRHKRLLEHLASGTAEASTSALSHQSLAWQKRLSALSALQVPHGSADSLCTASPCEVSEVSESVRFSFPDSLHCRLLSQLGREKCRHFCEVSNEIPHWFFLRVNPASQSANHDSQKVSKDLTDLGYSVQQCQHLDNCLKISGSGRVPVQQLSLYLRGRAEIQDESSQRVARLVDCKPDQTVIDLCSGAGGKLLNIATRLGPAGNLVMHEPRVGAVKRAQIRLDRAAIKRGPHFHFIGGGELDSWTGKADWVLADVPCSNTGSLRHHPECKYRCFELEDDWLDMLNLLRTQRQLLKRAAGLLKDGGLLVYSTCSSLTEENDLQVLWATSTASQLGLAIVTTEMRLPERSGSDGYYAAVLKRIAHAKVRTGAGIGKELQARGQGARLKARRFTKHQVAFWMPSE